MTEVEIKAEKIYLDGFGFVHKGQKLALPEDVASELVEKGQASLDVVED